MSLTRSQVARRLGRSVATVRALEAQGILNPRRGPRAQRMFDTDEVETLADEVSSTGRALPLTKWSFGSVDVERDRGAAGHVHRERPAARREIVALERDQVALQAELDALREQVLEVVEDMLTSMPRRSSALSALERLVAAVR